ncbi:hypothetical protein [Mycolicibacterium houstonense]|uniref:hypothetical protein n=1 Tax=Mycolicibacterium houstonense TaxID=146021 RepID=UPI000AE14C6F|nr:hypothetical protein [Mycolicibacterium houstonense]
MKFGKPERRTLSSVFAKDVQSGDVLCECLYKYDQSRTTDSVYREEGRVLAVNPRPAEGTVQISWRTAYGETRVEAVPLYQGVMVVR